MRSAIAVVVALCSACASAPAPGPALVPRATEIIARSHAILDAFDRGDLAAVGPVLGSSYVHLHSDHSVFDRNAELRELARPATIPSRRWSHEQAFVGTNTAMFVGEAREQDPGNRVHGGGYIHDGWYTLGWGRDGTDWKLVYLGWQPPRWESASSFWDQVFQNQVGFEHQPNRLLTTTVAGITPGTALDVATGQGRNALYLAAHGWTVTGVDTSDEGLRQAGEAAQHAGLRADMVHADVGTFDFGTDRWDLVALIYAPAALKRLPDLRRAVRPGGLVVYEYFAPAGPSDHAPGPGELAKEFTGWEILQDEEVEDVPDWAVDRAKLVRFVARKK
jgi:SAM-dependent methyltransferase